MTTTSPDYVYDRIGAGYARERRTDARWLARIASELRPGDTVVNVGAGTGCFEPPGHRVVAVEPSWTMLRQRAPGAAPVVRARAERLPFADDAFDVAFALLTVHHWTDLDAGLAELRRVAPRFVVLTYDVDVQDRFWLVRDYIPEITAMEAARVPSVDDLVARLGGARVETLPVPDGFSYGVMAAHWKEPEAYLDPAVRRACSALALTDARAVERGLRALAADVDSGAWARRHARLLELDEIDAGFRLLTGGR